jgi:hypothetical protein
MQSVPGKTRSRQGVQGDKGRRRVGRTSTHAPAQGNAFFQPDPDRFIKTRPFPKQGRRTDNDVPVASQSLRPGRIRPFGKLYGTSRFSTAAFACFKPKDISKIKAEENTFHIMAPIGAPVSHPEVQIDLTGSLYYTGTAHCLAPY